MSPSSDHRRLRRHRTILGTLFIVVSVMLIGYSGWQAAEQQNCNEAFAQNLAQRVQWQNQDRHALHVLIRSVFEDDSDAAQMEAYHNWLRVTERNQALRARTYLPELADCE